MGYLVSDSSCLGKLCVVIGPKHPTHAVLDSPANGVLMHASDYIPPTIFPGKKTAESAIKRSVAYHTKKWGESPEFVIITEHQLAEMVQSRNGKKRKKA